MGFGEEQVTLWNLEYGYVVATIEIKSFSLNPRCVWIKCDRVNLGYKHEKIDFKKLI